MKHATPRATGPRHAPARGQVAPALLALVSLAACAGACGPVEEGAGAPGQEGAGAPVGQAALAPVGTGALAPVPPLVTSWPAGTAFVLDGVPVTAEEVDRAAEVIALLEPQSSLLQLRRVALAKIVFPGIAARALDREARERMRAKAAEWRAVLQEGELAEGPLAGPLAVERLGGVSDFGFEPWRVALEAPLGAWSEVEGLGSFHLLQVLERSAANTPGQVVIRARVYDFPYLDPQAWRGSVEAALDRAELTIVDPAWRDVIPTWWQHRMRGGSS